ncbi:MAG: hypothetical protein JWR15_581 [Prosthecobacter sp.]|nr:hypothetical protein [Prosthecobacter sp.]
MRVAKERGMDDEGCRSAQPFATGSDGSAISIFSVYKVRPALNKG